MQIHLITDNSDTAVGMRLAGISYTIAKTQDECKNALSDCICNPQIGIILITQKLYSIHYELFNETKKTTSLPLITQIPETGSELKSDALTRYVADAVGIVG